MTYSGAAAAAAGVVLGFASITAIGRATSARPERPAGEATEPRPGPVGGVPRECGDRTGRIEDLRKLEANLGNRIDELKAADAVARFLPPKDLPPRFAGPAVGAAVEEAIARSHVGGRVYDVDCSAFPCLVTGQYAAANLVGKLQRELSTDPQYAEDLVLVLANGKDPGGGGGVLFGAIVFPRSEPRAAEILEAFKRRRADAMEKRMAAVSSIAVETPEPPGSEEER